jgi:hypothetical protein
VRGDVPMTKGFLFGVGSFVPFNVPGWAFGSGAKVNPQVERDP